jgi:hypothetical protein
VRKCPVIMLLLVLGLVASNSMGIDLHITRAQFWAKNEGVEISADEWLAYVASDPELQLWPENGRYFVRWRGDSKYEEPWLDWFQGNIKAKWPDTALYRKMLKIASALRAQVQDDEGTVYRNETDWTFDPQASLRATAVPGTSPWWKRLFRK